MKKSISVFSTTLILTVLTITSCEKDQNAPEVLNPVIADTTISGTQKSSSIEFDFENQDVIYKGADYITIAHEVGYNEIDEDYWLHVTSMSGDSFVTFFDSEVDHVTFEMYDEEFTQLGKFSVARDDLEVFDVVKYANGVWSDFVECLQDEYGSNWQSHLNSYIHSPASVPNDILLHIAGCFAAAVAGVLLGA